MKEFVADKLCFLAAGMLMALLIPWCFGPYTTIVLELILVISLVGLCRQILLLPIDLILKKRGKKTKKVRFDGSVAILKYDIIGKEFYCRCRFQTDDGPLFLLIPDAGSSVEEVINENLPPKDVLLTVTYYCFSKLLIEWRECSTESDR